MDPLLRGVCEQCIDAMLGDGEIDKIRKLVDMLDLPIASNEDASLGVFIGSMYSQLEAHYLKMYNRLPKKNEIEDYHSILRRRAPEIKSKFISQTNHQETTNPEATVENQVRPEKNLEDYHLVLRKKTEELKAEKELKTKPRKTNERRKTENKKKQEKKVKFSYNSSTRKEPIRRILGMPTKKKEAVSPTIR